MDKLDSSSTGGGRGGGGSDSSGEGTSGKHDGEGQPALFLRYPGLARSIPWCSFGVRRTPLECVALELPDGGERRIRVKRDDLTARPYGGNKVRKLEFILADAKARGATRVITAGAAGSHHALATAVYARRLGMEATLVLFPQARTDHVRRVLLLDQALGAELRFTPRMESVPFAVARARLAHLAEKPYVIAPGGSDPIGTLGYVSAGLELADQFAAESDPMGNAEDRRAADRDRDDDAAAASRGGEPARIHVAAGTLGTAAGLALGLALAGVDVPILATRITSRIVCNPVALRRLIDRTAEYLRRAGLDEATAPLSLAPSPRRGERGSEVRHGIPSAARAAAMIELRHDQIGAGYGRETEASRAAMRIFEAAGLALDATYTAKAAADLLATPDAPDGRSPLFLHTLSAFEPLDLARGTTPADLPPPFRAYLER